QEVMQMQLAYNIKTAGGKAVKDTVWFTVNDVEKADFWAKKFPEVNVDSLSVGQAVSTQQQKRLPVTAERGKKLFQRTGCVACHAVQGHGEGKVGPPLQGIFGTKQSLQNGKYVQVDEAYIRESILKPGQKVVKGYEAEMPSFLGILSTDEVASITEYIKS